MTFKDEKTKKVLRTKKILLNLYTFLLILSLVILFPLQVYKQVSFDNNFYDELYKENGVYEEFTEQRTWRLTEELWGYLKDNNELESVEWSSQDVEHMKDVKRLIKYSFQVHTFFLVLTLILLAILFSTTSNYIKVIRTSFIWAGSILLGLGGLFYLARPIFSTLFIGFHEVFFNNDLWIMDPAKDSLIGLYGGNFFYSIVVKIFSIVAIGAGIMLITGLILHLILWKMNKSKKSKSKKSKSKKSKKLT